MRIKRTRAAAQEGFTLIELLVVILIIGILAAIAIPAFLNQKGKAQDAQAKTVARTAMTAMETYANTNGGSYAGTNLLSSLASTEPALMTSSDSQAYLSAVTGSDNGYTITAYSPLTTETYVVTDAAGTVTRTCSPSGAGGCSDGGNW